jgi:hypothetical protein
LEIVVTIVAAQAAAPIGKIYQWNVQLVKAVVEGRRVIE